MKTAGRENPNRGATVPQQPSPWRGGSEQISLDHVGWEARKIPATGDVFFLDFSLYRTSQDLAGVDSRSMLGFNTAAMSEYSSQIRRAAIIAARSAVVLSVSIFVLIVFRVVLNGLFDDKWNFDWQLSVRFTAIVGMVWFCGQFIYTFFKLQAAAPSEAILESIPAPNDTRSKLVGFVAMEYYWLILNRTFVVFISPEAL